MRREDLYGEGYESEGVLGEEEEEDVERMEATSERKSATPSITSYAMPSARASSISLIVTMTTTTVRLREPRIIVTTDSVKTLFIVRDCLLM